MGWDCAGATLMGCGKVGCKDCKVRCKDCIESYTSLASDVSGDECQRGVCCARMWVM